MDVLTEMAKATGVNCGPGEMCLLDWFAGQALASMPVLSVLEEDAITARAAQAYTIACAMMDEREQTLAEIRTQVKAKCEAANAANAAERKVYEEQKAARKVYEERKAADAA